MQPEHCCPSAVHPCCILSLPRLTPPAAGTALLFFRTYRFSSHEHCPPLSSLDKKRQGYQQGKEIETGKKRPFTSTQSHDEQEGWQKTIPVGRVMSNDAKGRQHQGRSGQCHEPEPEKSRPDREERYAGPAVVGRVTFLQQPEMGYLPDKEQSGQGY